MRPFLLIFTCIIPILTMCVNADVDHDISHESDQKLRALDGFNSVTWYGQMFELLFYIFFPLMLLLVLGACVFMMFVFGRNRGELVYLVRV